MWDREAVYNNNRNILFLQKNPIKEYADFQKRTLHNQLCGASTGTAVTRVTPRILWVYVMNYKCRQRSCLFYLIFCTGTKTKFSFLPLQRNSRFRKLTVQAYGVPFLHRLTLKLCREKNWSSWWMKRSNEMFILSARSRMMMKQCDEGMKERNDIKDCFGRK